MKNSDVVTVFEVLTLLSQLYARYWQPVEQVVGSVFLCHGFGEHLGWYDGLATQLAKLGLLVFGHDHQGHGRSEGRRAYIDTVDEFVSDVLRHSVEMKVELQGLPMFLYGHSMGGMIAVASVMKNPSFFSGLILEGALIIPDPHEVTPTRLLLGRIISPILPEMQMGRVRVEQVRRLDTGLRARDAAAYKNNKAKCLLDALETPLSHCHT